MANTSSVGGRLSGRRYASRPGPDGDAVLLYATVLSNLRKMDPQHSKLRINYR